MTQREFCTLSLATICGFIGGSVASWPHPVHAASDVVRASRFELVNESGGQIGVWGRDEEGHASLAFTAKGGKNLAVFGVRSDASPFLNMAGADGKVRLTLRLESGEKPLLGMGDETWEGRVLLGFVGQDTKSAGDDWGLLFRAPGSVADLASIGVVSDSAGRRSGTIAVRGSTGRRWSAPR